MAMCLGRNPSHMDSEMRILMLTCHPTIRGPFPKILPLLSNALRSQGATVETEPWGRHVEGEGLLDKLLGRPGDIVRVIRRLRREPPYDLLLLHTATEWRNYSRDIPLLWLCRRLVSSIVVQFHGSAVELISGPRHGAFKKASKAVLRLSDAVLVLSSEEQRQWRQFFPQGEFFVTCNPFQSSEALAKDSAATWDLPSDMPVLLFVGRLIVEKGIFDLLEALALLVRQMQVHVLVAGSGPMEQEFKERIETLGLEKNVTLTGYLDASTLRQAYRAADMFLFPSWSEGFPTVITEAMDAGLPIVTTHIRGAADHLEDGVNACFVPPRRPEVLAETVVRVLSDKALRRRMAESNRAKVKAFSPEIIGKRYLAILEEIAGRPKTKQRLALKAKDTETDERL